MKKIFTIGYGDKNFGDFTRLLKDNGVKLVLDVRYFPSSKWLEYNKEELKENLKANKIDYNHLEELGGYRNEGYKKHVTTDEFKRGLEKLTRSAKAKTAVIMCLESYPTSCHRRFITSVLKGRGWAVIHLVGKKGKHLR